MFFHLLSPLLPEFPLRARKRTASDLGLKDTFAIYLQVLFQEESTSFKMEERMKVMSSDRPSISL